MNFTSITTALGAVALVSAGGAAAQSAPSFAAWATGLGKTVYQCPTAPVSSVQNPYFGFNGNPAVAGFSCQQVGPFSLNGKSWFVQNVNGLKPPAPPGCKTAQPYCRVNNLRLCSLHYVAFPASPQVHGPFGGPIGPKGCEKLWSEEVVSTVP